MLDLQQQKSPRDQEMERLRMRGDLDGMEDLVLEEWLAKRKAARQASPKQQ